ncbi:MAG: ferritin [Methanospirillaceae archaeon]|nr:ferritin [Methanospirillaceae archaeon]
MNTKMEKAINEQINAELYSAYLYLSMAAWYSSSGLKGFANWERIQAQEERDHALKFYDYVLARGGAVTLTPIAGPPTEWRTPADAFAFQLEHEQKVTELITNLVNLAQKEKDHASYNMLQWFIDEQVEEEENARDILDKLKLIEGEKGTGVLFMLDKELATRVYTPPVVEKT